LQDGVINIILHPCKKVKAKRAGEDEQTIVGKDR
jgi:hypothetical protein